MKPDANTLRRLYLDERLTTRQIGAHYAVSKTSVQRWLHREGIDTRPANRGLENRGITAPTRDELVSLIHERHLNYVEIGALYGVDNSAVTHWVRRHGIRPLTLWESRRKGRPVYDPGADELRRWYESGIGVHEIATRCGVSDGLIYTWLERAGIARVASGFNGGVRYQCRDGHSARSVYEQRVDDWLHAHGIAHEVEPPLAGGRNLRGDFLANGWHIEIWGVYNRPDYTARKKRKRRLYAAHGLRLIEINAVDFSATGKGRWERKLRACLTSAPSPQLGLAFPLSETA